MPETITLADGTEREVPTAEEMTGFTERAAHADTLVASLTDIFKPGEGQDLLEVAKDFAEDPNNRNWRSLRETSKRSAALLKEKGIEIDAEGKVVSSQAPAAQDPQEVQKIIDQSFQNRDVDTAMGSYTAEERAAIKPIFDRLQQLGGILENNLTLAESTAFPDKAKDISERRAFASNGGAPRVDDPNKKANYAETPDGVAAAGAMGLRSGVPAAKK